MESLPQMFARSVALVPDQPVILMDQPVSYRSFAAQVGRLAEGLAQHGIGPGDRVGLCLTSAYEMAQLFWACQHLGAVPAPLTAMLTVPELAAIASEAGFAALIGDTKTSATLASAAPDLLRLSAEGGAGARAYGMALSSTSEPRPAAQPNLHDPACVFFTSGTTGRPKGIEQSHFALAASLRDMAVSHRSRFGHEIYLGAVPLFTNFGMNVTVNLAIYTGGAVALHDRWDTDRVLDSIARHRVTYVGGTPTMFVYLLSALQAKASDLSSLRLCIVGGAPVPQPVVEQFETLSGARVVQVYGATEVCGQVAQEPSAGPRRAGSVGLPVGSARIAIIGPEGTPLPAGNVGEVVISGDTLAMGYIGGAEDSFTPGGWRSGDLGYLDEDGFLFLVDRKKDLIITGGHNIYPLELESCLYRHPDVEICAVVAAPDPAKGEIPVAVVVLRAGATASADDLMRHCQDSLSAYKRPRRIELVDEIPVEAAKIRKRELREALISDDLDRFRTAPNSTEPAR